MEISSSARGQGYLAGVLSSDRTVGRSRECEQSGGQRLNELQPLLMPLPSEWLVEQERAEPLHHEHQVQTVCTPLGQLPAVRPLSLGCEAQQATIGCGSRVGLQVVVLVEW